MFSQQVFCWISTWTTHEKNVSGNFYATNSKPLFMMCVSYLFFPCFKFDVLAKLCNLYNIHELIHIIWKFNGLHWLILCVYLHVYGHIHGMIHMGRQEELFLPLYHLGFWCLTQISRTASKHPYLLNYLKKKTLHICYFLWKWTLYL